MKIGLQYDDKSRFYLSHRGMDPRVERVCDGRDLLEQQSTNEHDVETQADPPERCGEFLVTVCVTDVSRVGRMCEEFLWEEF